MRCTLFAVVQGEDASEELFDMFQGLPAIFERYDHGADLGAQQYIARLSDDAFQVNMTTRCYFHREGWLARYVFYRNRLGPGFYGASHSREGGKLHVCTRGHAYDVEDFKLYPHNIISRDQGVFFECGQGCVSEWFTSIGRPRRVLGWNGDYSMSEEIENGFRNGDQSNMLIWDKHTDIYRDADEAEKKRLRDMAYPETPIQSPTLTIT